MLGGDDFSPAAGAGAEEDKRNESEEKAGHVECWIMDVGFSVGNARGMLKHMLNFRF